MARFNGRVVRSFEEYKRLTSEEKEFFTFEQLNKIEEIYNKVENLHKRFASKRVEVIVYTFIGIILIAFVGALTTLVFM